MKKFIIFFLLINLSIIPQETANNDNDTENTDSEIDIDEKIEQVRLYVLENNLKKISRMSVKAVARINSLHDNRREFWKLLKRESWIKKVDRIFFKINRERALHSK